jgi:uncharacterized protein CbrC (UPF0167 family)
MSLPSFRYHPNPTESGSIVSSAAECRSCGGSRGHIYIGPVYSEEDLADAICPWCIADGSAHRKFDAVFVDAEAFADAVPEAVVAEVTERTPGYSSWQSEVWPTCCGDATAFIMPAGISELRARDRSLEGFALNHIIYNMEISGGAATRLLQSLNRESGPTAYLFECLHCRQHHFHIDHP